MTNFIKFPSIEQFNRVVRAVKSKAEFSGFDENEKPIYDYLREKPVLHFVGSVKCHGMNSAVCSLNGETWFQKHSDIITLEHDCMGFAAFMAKPSRKTIFDNIFKELAKTYDAKQCIFAIFGEFAGNGIQKGVALSQLSKRFFAFDIKIINKDDSTDSFWLSNDLVKQYIQDYSDELIFNIYNFKTFNVVIDFNHPEQIQNLLIEYVEQVEKECPVGKAFGVSGIGEGIVFKCVDKDYEDSGYWFKCKGEKHASSHVKTLVPVDLEKVKSIEEFVEKTVTESRLNQGISEMIQADKELDMKNIGDFIRWIMSDIVKEESDTLCESNLCARDVNSKIALKAKAFFIDYLRKNI